MLLQIRMYGDVSYLLYYLVRPLMILDVSPYPNELQQQRGVQVVNNEMQRQK